VEIVSNKGKRKLLQFLNLKYKWNWFFRFRIVHFTLQHVLIKKAFSNINLRMRTERRQNDFCVVWWMYGNRKHVFWYSSMKLILSQSLISYDPLYIVFWHCCFFGKGRIYFSIYLYFEISISNYSNFNGFVKFKF